ncbi:hypothetical protein HZH66_013004 [Vespula vulgaris]|uniref:Uncharacterized protein n=1 Tax=Vespula vulgaris TaxID=7454 RepID=A0A834JAY0_VESVU|nr:hypothetical protein HZH66_013004 [Vespula vulgaris]
MVEVMTGDEKKRIERRNREIKLELIDHFVRKKVSRRNIIIHVERYTSQRVILPVPDDPFTANDTYNFLRAIHHPIEFRSVAYGVNTKGRCERKVPEYGMEWDGMG